MMPKVSVVIPTFGRQALLHRAINSVLRQTMCDLEVIVVVDGNDLETINYLQQITDTRVRSIVHEVKKGAGVARDTGAEHSTGEWVAYLDDDDEWLPEKIEKQLAVAPVSPAIMMMSSRVVTPIATFIRPEEPYDGTIPLDEWLFDRKSWFANGGGFLQTSSLMIPRVLFERLRFRDTKQHEEWEFVIRAVKQFGYQLVTARDPLVVHYLGHNGPSLNKTYTWQRSLQWAEGLGPLLTHRALSAFCLTVVARSEANAGRFTAVLPLLKVALRKGKPTARQLFAFALIWILPVGLRHRLRALFSPRSQR